MAEAVHSALTAHSVVQYAVCVKCALHRVQSRIQRTLYSALCIEHSALEDADV